MPRHILPERSQERWRFVPFIPVKSTGHASMKSSHTQIKIGIRNEPFLEEHVLVGIDLEPANRRTPLVVHGMHPPEGPVAQYDIRMEDVRTLYLQIPFRTGLLGATDATERSGIDKRG